MSILMSLIFRTEEDVVDADLLQEARDEGLPMPNSFVDAAEAEPVFPEDDDLGDEDEVATTLVEVPVAAADSDDE